MNRLKIGSRLTFSFIILFLLMSLGSVVGLWQYAIVQAQADRLKQVDFQALGVLRVHNRILMLKDDLQQTAEIKDAAQFALHARPMQDDLAIDIQAAVESLRITPADQAQNTLFITQLEAIGRRLPEQIDAMIKQAQADDWFSLGLRLNEQVERASQTTSDIVKEIDARVDAERDAVLENMQRARRQAFVAIVGTGVLALAVASLLGIMLTRSIAFPLARLAEAARSLAAGDFQYRVDITGDDELATLGQSFNDAAAQLAELYNHLEDLVRQRTEELRYRALQLETSIAVAQSITSILDLDELLQQVAELIKASYGYYFVGIALTNELESHVVVRAGSGAAGKHLIEEGLQLEIGKDGIVGYSAQTRQPILVNDVAADGRYKHVDVLQDVQSELALPLEMGGRLLGVLDIQSDRAAWFKEEDVPVLQLLANEVAIAIHNASLYQAERSRRALAETLYKVGQALSGTLHLDEVLNLILKYLAEIVPYDRASLLLERGEVLEFAAARGFPGDIDPLEMQVAIKGNDVFQEIYQSRKPLCVPDVLKRADWQQVNALSSARSWLGVPLIRADGVIGMLSLVRETYNPYSEDEITLSGTFAVQAAIALENAQLYERITRFNQQLEHKVQERTEELQKAYNQLERLDRNKSDFIAIASHELRTPLTVVQGYSGMLVNDNIIQQNAYHHRAISGIYEGTQRMHEIVNTMLDMVKIDNQTLKLHPKAFSLALLIESVAGGFGKATTQRRLTLTCVGLEDLPEIEADIDELRKVFHHLIVNAIKYTPDGGTITIAGNYLSGDGDDTAEAVEIVVSDTGIGIDADFHELVFEKFFQTGEVNFHSSGKIKFKAGGPGLGLAIARGIVEAHNGRIWVESSGHDEETFPGSAFYVILPVHQAGECP